VIKSFTRPTKLFQNLRNAGKVKATGVVVAAPKYQRINAINEHAAKQLEKRDITQAWSQNIIDHADFALKQRDGERHAFYSSKGFAVLTETGMLATAGKLDDNGQILYNEVIKYVNGTK